MDKMKRTCFSAATILIIAIGIFIGIKNAYHVPFIEAPVFMKVVIWAPDMHKVIPVKGPPPIDAEGDPGNYRDRSVTINKLTPLGKKSFITIANAPMFSLGRVGLGGNKPLALSAVKQMLQQREAIPALKELVSISTPEGSLYALCGLYIVDHHEFEISVNGLHQNSFKKVVTASGCNIIAKDYGEVVAFIKSGKASKFVQEKWE